MKALTQRQLQILFFVDKYRRTYHCSPTLRELCQNFGWVSPQASSSHMQALTVKGCVIPVVGANGCARGYRLSSKGQEILLKFKAS